MVTEKDLYVGREWQYCSTFYKFTTNPKEGNIEFENIRTDCKFRNYKIDALLRNFNSGRYILNKPINKVYELW
jgi:hypothetical protein